MASVSYQIANLLEKVGLVLSTFFGYNYFYSLPAFDREIL